MGYWEETTPLSFQKQFASPFLSSDILFPQSALHRPHWDGRRPKTDFSALAGNDLDRQRFPRAACQRRDSVCIINKCDSFVIGKSVRIIS
ncbi:MAG: hypothetical protein IJI34_11750 [Clostridia bacterium]|nr:hypothetical protein [Clostridia bacterium]